MIQELLPQAERIGAILKARGETVSVAESSTAGLISAALLAVGGASAYFMGGAVVYTRASRTELLRVTEAEFAAMTGITPSTALTRWRRTGGSSRAEALPTRARKWSRRHPIASS